MSHFVGREEDIINITGYLDFTTSDVQVVHIVGPPGFGKSTLAMKIGEIFLRKGVKVHYVDVRQKMVRDIDTLAEKIVFSMVESRKTRVKLSDLDEKIIKQHKQTLIIIDNCDELIEHTEEEFWKAIKALTLASPMKSVRYLLTSQHQIADIGHFRLHAIYNLSSEAAIKLLSKLAPGLTADQKRQIAHLTGNVPLALEVIGAIFKFPDAPTAENVIQGLTNHPLRTLSPAQLLSKVDASIGLAFSYLTDELKLSCVNLSHFPGSFNTESASFIFSFTKGMINELVQRSLLQSSHGGKRYYFHQLLKKFFLSQEGGGDHLQQQFDIQFQQYFIHTLENIIAKYDQTLELTQLDEEKHNINHMFTLFEMAKHVNITFSGIQVALHAVEMRILHLRFQPTEVKEVTMKMLSALDSYTPMEQTEVTSFLTTYINVTKKVAEQHWPGSKTVAIKTLASRRQRVDEGYKEHKISVTEFTNFYYVLAQYYKENQDYIISTRCHAHILATIHGQLRHCSPYCDYLSVSIAYDNIGDRMQAFDFRQLAYQYQLDSLKGMEYAKLILDFYNDYSNISVGNDTTEAQKFEVVITNDIYPYLMTADRFEYFEEVYYVAIEFFRAKNLEKQVVQLQNRMIYIHNVELCTENNCYTRSLKRGEHFNEMKLFAKDYLLACDQPGLIASCEFKCAAHYAEVAEEAYSRKCYHLAIWAGEQSCAYIDKLGKHYTVLKYKPEYIIAVSYYQVGNNHSATRASLKQAVEHINAAIRYQYFSMELRITRAILSFYTIVVNRMLSNPLHYIYILKDVMGFWAIILPLVLTATPIVSLVQGQCEEEITSAETGLTTQNNFFLPQFDTIYKYYRLDVLESSAFYFFLCCTLAIYYLICFRVCFYCYTLPVRWSFHTRFRTLLCILIIILLFLSDWL